ncbi:MAG: PASTA domain-containing protein, partial [Gaiellales bacterium]
KPHNVVVAPDGRLKVTDFGIARAGASQMTEVGSIVGTAQYLSPEQARGEVVGPPSDLYSVGIVLYEMLTGRVPFEGDSAVAIAMKHLSEEPVPPSVYAPGTPPALEQVVLRALAKDAGDRYQTAEEMAADLDRARRGVALSPRTEQMTRIVAPSRTAQQTRVQPAHDATRVWDREPPPPRTPPPAPVRPRRSRWPWVLLALLVLAAGGVTAVALSGVIGGGGGTTGTTVASVTIPNGLRGLDEGHAQARLEALNLKVRMAQEFSPALPPGVVLRASPPGGARVASGSTVTLYVSKGASLVAVPALKGHTLADATAALKAKKLTSVETNENSLEPKGTVIAQDPAAGQLVAPNTSVAITVSDGPKQVNVPDVRGEDLLTARTNLEAVGLAEGTVTRASSTTDTLNTVISTNPAGNTQAPQGMHVDIVISTGPPKISMPDVIGETAEQAAIDIQNAGLQPKPPSTRTVTDPAQDGKVLATSPRAGIPSRQGTPVIIVVGSYTAPTTDTTPTVTTPTVTTPTDTTPTPPPVGQ